MTIHPTAKLVLVVALVVASFALSPIANAALLGAMLVVGLLSEAPVRLFKGLVAFTTPLASSLLLIGAADSTATGSWWSFGPFGFGPQQATWTLTIFVRLVILIAAVQLFVATTRPEALHAALIQARLPKTVCYAFTAAAGFVPHLTDRIAAVREAQLSRGVRFRRGSPRALSLVGPLLLSALEEAADREITLLVRGFGLPGRPTSLYSPVWRPVDTVVILAAAGIVALAILHGSAGA